MAIFDKIRASPEGGATIGSIRLRPGKSVVGSVIRTGIAVGGAYVGGRAAVELGGRPSTSTGEQSVAPRAPITLLAGTGAGSAGRSATPIVPSAAGGVVPGLISIGMDWIRRRTGGQETAFRALPAEQCPTGTIKSPLGCINPPAGEVTGGGVMLTYGEAVNGRYGPGLVPATDDVTIRRCPRGAVLGKDGLCYDKRKLRKDERMWDPGRKPLLTGGDLNAIARAARAAGRMKAQQRRLQGLGLLPRPKSRRMIELELRHAGKLRK